MSKLETPGLVRGASNILRGIHSVFRYKYAWIGFTLLYISLYVYIFMNWDESVKKQFSLGMDVMYFAVLSVILVVTVGWQFIHFNQVSLE